MEKGMSRPAEETIDIVRRRGQTYLVGSEEELSLFKLVVESLERLPASERDKLLTRWDRATFYAQGFGHLGIVEYRTALRPSSVVVATPEKKGRILLFYKSGIVASLILTLSVIAVTVSGVMATDLGVPVALALFGIMLAFSIERVRFVRRSKKLASSYKSL